VLLCAGVVVVVLGVLGAVVCLAVVRWPVCWCSVVPGVPFVAGVWPVCGPGGVGCPWVRSDRCCCGCGLG
jgi:hypothetical protein